VILKGEKSHVTLGLMDGFCIQAVKGFLGNKNKNKNKIFRGGGWSPT